MTTMFAAIVSGGAIGVADQYLCLLLLSVSARFEFLQLPSEISFMSSDWFIVIIGIIWIATVLPAYGSLVDPVLLRFVNTTIGLLSGILVPASGALLSIATANFVGNSETTASAVQTIAYHAINSPSSDLWLIGGGGAFVASLFTFIKFLIKPMIAAASGMTATTASAATYKTIENVTSVVVMTIIYFLASMNPWLLIVFMAIITLVLLAILAFAIYQMWKLKQGIGKVIRLFQANPKAGFAVSLEPFIWGSGWILIKGWQSGTNKLILWGVSLFVIWFILPVVFFLFPPIIPFIIFSATLAGIYFIGIKSAKKLFATLEKEYGNQISNSANSPMREYASTIALSLNNPSFPNSNLSPVTQSPSLQFCPKCNKRMETRTSPKGRKFLVCPNFQECKQQAISID